MPHKPNANEMRRAAARRLGRNLVAMTEASEAEFEQVDEVVGGGISYLLGTVLLALFGAILGSGWALWLQGLVGVAVAALVVVARQVWRANTPPPAPPDPDPPFVRVTPRRRRRGGGRNRR
ncbi:MAG: hypothetical protein K2R93_21770 [Gemmatimonadaceae bacterium]|nr:hypothetical protein [Gemmatimonadaceae bacterium]